MFAVRQRLDRDLGVPTAGSAHRDCVDLTAVQRVGETLDVHLSGLGQPDVGGDPFTLGGNGVDKCDDLGVGHGLDDLGVQGPDDPAPDDGKAHLPNPLSVDGYR